MRSEQYLANLRPTQGFNILAKGRITLKSFNKTYDFNAPTTISSFRN